MTLSLKSIEPAQGDTMGGNLVKIFGDGITASTRMFFGDIPTPTLMVQEGSCFVQAPAHPVGICSVTALANTERSCLAAAYCYQRADLTSESDLTRLVRTLLQQLKAHILQSTSATVDVEYTGYQGSEPSLAALATLPALVLTGPDIHENRVSSTNVGWELLDAQGNLVQYKPAYTVDLSFNLIGASQSTLELLNLLSACVIFLSHTPTVCLPRDPTLPAAGVVHWPLSITGDTRTHLNQADGIKTFSAHFKIQGFDLSCAQPRAIAAPTQDAWVHTAASGAHL